jgi:hypothetical protein
MNTSFSINPRKIDEGALRELDMALRKSAGKISPTDESNRKIINEYSIASFRNKDIPKEFDKYKGAWEKGASDPLWELKKSVDALKNLEKMGSLDKAAYENYLPELFFDKTLLSLYASPSEMLEDILIEKSYRAFAGIANKAREIALEKSISPNELVKHYDLRDEIVRRVYPTADSYLNMDYLSTNATNLVYKAGHLGVEQYSKNGVLGGLVKKVADSKMPSIEEVIALTNMKALRSKNTAERIYGKI